MAARQERIRFRKMKGYGSNGFQTIKAEFMITHKNSTPQKDTKFDRGWSLVSFLSYYFLQKAIVS
jgi:hypothetical protein